MNAGHIRLPLPRQLPKTAHHLRGLTSRVHDGLGNREYRFQHPEAVGRVTSDSVLL
jgi:hypothetical protein